VTQVSVNKPNLKTQIRVNRDNACARHNIPVIYWDGQIEIHTCHLFGSSSGKCKYLHVPQGAIWENAVFRLITVMLFRGIVGCMHVFCIKNVYIFTIILCLFHFVCYAMRPYLGQRTHGGFKPQTRGRLAQGQGHLFEQSILITHIHCKYYELSTMLC